MQVSSLIPAHIHSTRPWSFLCHHVEWVSGSAFNSFLQKPLPKLSALLASHQITNHQSPITNHQILGTPLKKASPTGNESLLWPSLDPESFRGHETKVVADGGVGSTLFLQVCSQLMVPAREFEGRGASILDNLHHQTTVGWLVGWLVDFMVG